MGHGRTLEPDPDIYLPLVECIANLRREFSLYVKGDYRDGSGSSAVAINGDPIDAGKASDESFPNFYLSF